MYDSSKRLLTAEADRLLMEDRTVGKTRSTIKLGSDKEWKRTEARHYNLAERHNEQLKEGLHSHEIARSSEERFLEEETLKEMIIQIYDHFDAEKVVTTVLDSILLGGCDVHDNIEISKRTGLKVEQITSAKRKLNYYAKKHDLRIDD